MSIIRRERGEGLVEFALILPIFLLVTIGLMDLGQAMFQQNTLAFAAREATRYAIVHGSNGSPKAGPGSGDTCTASTTYSSPAQQCVTTAIVDLVSKDTIGVRGVTVTTTWLNGDNNRKSRVTVDVTAQTTATLWLIKSVMSPTLRASSTLVIEQ